MSEEEALVRVVLQALADLSPSAEHRSAAHSIPLEAYRSRWADRRGELVVEVHRRLGGQG